MALRRKAAAKEVDLDAMVRSGPQGAYEALQLYRSRAIRLRSKNDLSSALNSISAGALCLFSAGYENAGAELAMLLLDFLNESGKEIDAELRQLIGNLEQAFPPTSPHRVEFLKGCVKWTVKHSNREFGDPAMHVTLAKCLWDINDKSAVYHFAAGEAPEQFCQRLEDTCGSESAQIPRERFLTLCILHFLALENLRDANELMVCYRRAQKGRGLSMESDLISFCKYLLLTCRRDAQPLFKTLVNKYASVLDFDENVPALLTGPIGQKYFGIQPKSNPMMSMLQQMLA